tara:strand:+ start:1907 stop:2365 length:459 start_codon:yes stop_codon:yes gene_type:complete
MAFNGNFMCSSFKKELLFGVHDFDTSASGDAFKLALYTNSATFTAATAAFTTGNEVSGTNYTSGGGVLNTIDPTLSGTTALVDFDNLVFSNVTLSAVRGALMYNSTPDTTSISVTNPTVLVLDFSADKAASSGDFTIVFPAADASNAIIRIA